MVRWTRATPIPASAWAGPAPADFAALLDVPPDRARALVCAAVRETFEESGVLLAGASHDDLVAGPAPRWPRTGTPCWTGPASLAEVLGRRGLVLRTDLLHPWAHWITPEASSRAASTPGSSSPPCPRARTPRRRRRVGDHADPGESESGAWLSPASALEAARAGQMTLLPPTAVTLGELAGHPDVSAILARRQVITPRLPKLIVRGRAGAAGAAPARTRVRAPARTAGRCGAGVTAPTPGIDGFRTPRATCLLAPNPSPMTLDGTNTWLIAEPGSSSVVVVDPGPDDEAPSAPGARRGVERASAGWRRSC